MTSFLLSGLETKESVYSLWDTVSISAWANRIVSFLLSATIGYFLIELNNTSAITRMRASVQTSLYSLLIMAYPGIHLLYAGDIAAVTFLISLYFLLKSYQDPWPAGYLFHPFVFLSTDSIVFPQLTYFVPIWLLGASNFQALTFRSFCGVVAGWGVPYWFLLGHTFFHNEMVLFYQPFVNPISFRPTDFGHDFCLWEVVALGYLFILHVVSSIHYIVAGYEDKTRTRTYLRFLISLNFCIFLFIMLQPTLGMSLLSLLPIGASILVEHLFILTDSRTSNLFFIGSMVTLIVLFRFNTWAPL